MLQIRNIKKTYSTGKIRVEALKGISLDFPEKGLVFIVGKSGSGKSTLLNIIGGLDKMTSGEIVIDGKSTSNFSSSDFDAFRNYYIGFIFQDFNLIDEINVYDNIALALKIQAKGHDNNTIEDSLKMVGLEGLGYRKPNELSGGQRQRVSIARALVKDPHIILADEPTGALDSKTGEALILTLKNLSRNKLVIVVTHDEDMALNYGDEIIEIKDGQVFNHIVSTNEGIQNKEEILDNLVKYNSSSLILDEKEINSKLKKGETNYICINTSKETVSLAYSDAFPYLYERKEAFNRFKEVENESNKEVIKTNEKRITNKARIKILECFKMALQSFKRKKNRFIALVLLSIASLYLFSVGWLFSTINIPNIVANNSNKINLPISYICKKDDSSWYNSKVVLDKEVKEELEDEYNQKFGYSTNFAINYVNPSVASSSVFAMNHFRGVIEIDDVKDLGFEVNGKSTSGFNEIIITDYAASELVRTGFVGLDNDELKILYLNDINEFLNKEMAILNVYGNYTYYKIVGIIDTDYENYLHLISKDVTMAYLDEETNNFEILKQNVYSKIFVCNDFLANNVALSVANNDGDININYSYKYNGYDYKSNLYYYFSSSNDKSALKTRENLPLSSVALWGNIPDKLEDNQIIIHYDQISYMIDEGTSINKFMEDFVVEDMTFTKYDYNNMIERDIAKDLEVVAIIDDNDRYGSDNLYVSEKLFATFVSKISEVQYTDLVFELPDSDDATQRLLKRLHEDGYEVGEVVGVDYSIKELIDIIGPAFIYIAIFFGFFAFLIVFNFISSSIKARRKEIGILRSMGARNSDVIRIFGSEIFIMSLIIFIVSIYFTNSTVNSINAIFTGVISLTFFKVLFIYFVCVLFLVIASIIPLVKILKNNPIDAIRKVF